MTFLARLFGREVNPSDHARFLAKLGAAKRARTKAETTDALRADIAAGRISHLGWKR